MYKKIYKKSNDNTTLVKTLKNWKYMKISKKMMKNKKRQRK